MPEAFQAHTLHTLWTKEEPRRARASPVQRKPREREMNIEKTEFISLEEVTSHSDEREIPSIKKKNLHGFTLIELMIVIAVIGILSGIAIPQYSLHRTRAFNAVAEADLRNAATAQEAYFIDHGTYCSVETNLIGPTYMLFFSKGVIFEIDPAGTDAFGYVMHARHDRGDTTFTISGPGGGINEAN